MIWALTLTNVYWPGSSRSSNEDSKALSKAFYCVEQPLFYRYWRQVGPNGGGTGQIGSGSEWREANQIEIFDEIIISSVWDGVSQLLQREGLSCFDWQPLDRTMLKQAASKKTASLNGSGH